MKKITTILCFLLVCPSAAFAYLDPGSGSILISALIGLLATAFFSFKGFYYKARNLYIGFFNLRTDKDGYKLIFYSEGGQYWLSFKPILVSLDRMGISALYLTSGKTDPGLNFISNYIKTRYIGEGNKAYIYLNTLEAELVVMTTPGLDVLQIRRSKGVKHYAYIPHSPVDMGTYKLFSFECFDTIFLTGGYQKRTIRTLEKLRGTKAKQLIDAGCPYMDALSNKLLHYQEKNFRAESQKKTILIAPTWGKNNILKKFGSKPIIKLLESGFEVIIRPHPQSLKVEKELINKLRQELGGFDNIKWDEKSDSFDSLVSSDLLISSLSGVVFDFALVFNKPVITVEFDYDFTGQEANDLPFDLWELNLMDQIGFKIKPAQLNTLVEFVNKALKERIRKEEFVKLRDQHLFNNNKSGEVIANKLIAIMEDLRK